MEFESVIRNRHATRKFKRDKLEKEKIGKILEAGRLAPTAKNIQPIKVIVVENEIEKIENATPCRYHAPVVLIVCGNTEEAFHKEDHSTYEMDACIVATHMMLEATNLGVGNIWIELFDKEQIKNDFSLPQNLVPICLIPLGYEADDCPVSAGHNTRKPLEEIVDYR